MTRVPNVDARERVDPTPLPKGEYVCRIIDIDEPKPSKVRDHAFHMRFTLEVAEGEFMGRQLFEYFGGYLGTVRLIYANRAMFIGQTHPVGVRIVDFQGYKHNSAMIKWRYYGPTAPSENTD